MNEQQAAAPAEDAAFSVLERSYQCQLDGATLRTLVRVRLTGFRGGFRRVWQRVLTQGRAAVLLRLIEVRWGKRRPLLLSEVEKLFGPSEAA